jgi:hypothetical protein
MEQAPHESPEQRVFQSDRSEDQPCHNAEKGARSDLNQQISLNLRIDLVENLQGDLLFRQCVAADAHQGATETVTGDEQEIHERNDDDELANAG